MRCIWVFAFVGAVTLTLLAGVTAERTSAQEPSVQRAAWSFSAGEFVQVDPAGSCLHQRESPALDAPILTCLVPGRSLVLEAGTTDADGYRWRQARADGILGWVAEAFLVPFQGAPACNTELAARRLASGLAEPWPAEGRGTYRVWGGGTVEGLMTAAWADGHAVTSVWAVAPGDTRFLGYHSTAPAAVNAAFLARFPDGRMPVGTILYLIQGLDGSPPPRPLPTGPAPSSRGTPIPEVEAAAIAVIDDASGAVLFERQGDRPLPMASLTKLATAVVAAEDADPARWELSHLDAATFAGESVMGLRPGDCFRVQDLVAGLLLPSGNDAARVLAAAVAGSQEQFVARLNALAARLGLAATHFTDPHGVGGPDHYASAVDLAALMRLALRVPEVAPLLASTTVRAEGSRTLRLRNGTALLVSYPGLIGVKTGFTEEAGPTIVAAAERDGHRLIVVLLNAPDRVRDAAALLDWGFADVVWP